MNEITKKFVETQDSIYNLSKSFNVSSEEVIKQLKDDGFLYAKRGAISKLIINLKLAADYYLAHEDINISEICKKFSVSHSTFPKYLKYYLGITIEKRVKSNFNDKIFDSIDTEEKAYWLGFIYADGTISSSPLKTGKKSYNFELSLKIEDANHLEKLQKLLETPRPVLKVTNRCRLLVNSKHLWETLNNYGCTPRKSLTLKFPDENIFKSKDLIRHFIRGYFDGDGCISYGNKEHTILNMQLLGTKSFLQSCLLYLPEEFKNLTLRHNHNNEKEETYLINTSNSKAYRFFKFLYLNSNIYLERKFSRFALYHSNMINVGSKNGGGCDANTVLNSEIAKGSESV